MGSTQAHRGVGTRGSLLVLQRGEFGEGTLGVSELEEQGASRGQAYGSKPVLQRGTVWRGDIGGVSRVGGAGDNMGGHPGL